ncbi:MAG: roadblock/LC7 domain-containing protein [Planctomycetota bacterium]|jgi:predicted regulator of Ras-like GTPase activity (Roadblock/LC7/MglB family)
MINIIGDEQVEKTEHILEKDLITSGVNTAVVVDMAGHVIANSNKEDCKHDVYSLAALATGNFGAVAAMAKLVGEEEFSLLFHKGKEENLHFAKINNRLLLITTFGSEISLGLLRMKIDESIKKIKSLW